jgi:glycine/D-amino acid oxidase-like deaminating enzyme
LIVLSSQLSTVDKIRKRNPATEDFILDTHPDNPNVTVGAGFSGHGFKFGSLTDRILSELSQNGKTTLPEIEKARHLFELGKPNNR